MQTLYAAQKMHIHFYAAGHHVIERYEVKA
jgi:putative NIF3 family GTP cyclohydrolase 1 type 2